MKAWLKIVNENCSHMGALPIAVGLATTIACQTTHHSATHAEPLPTPGAAADLRQGLERPMRDETTQKDPSVADFMERWATAPSTYPDATLRFQNGIAHWKGGLSTVSLSGTGKVTVTNRRGENEVSFQQTLPVDELQALLHELLTHRVFELKSARQLGKPDEGRIILDLSAPTEKIQLHTELWDGERWQNPHLQAVVERLQKLMTTVSKGQVKY